MRTPLFIRLLPDTVVLRLATLWGLGHLGRAPGTLGSIAGLLAFVAVFFNAGPVFGAIVGAVGTVLAVWICGEAEERLGETDPEAVVLDEFVAMPFCFAGLGPVTQQGETWLVLLVGFALFRGFDIAKPFPLGRLERLPGGLGIVADDLGAALATCLGLHALAFFWPAFFGLA